MRSRAASISWNVITLFQYTAAEGAAMVSRESGSSTAIASGGSTIVRSTTLLRGVERFANFGRKLLGVERFRQKEHVGIESIAGMQRFFQVAGNENDFRVRASLMQPFGKMPAAHLRHHHVGEKQIDLAPAALGDQPLSVIAIGRFHDLIAKFAQYAHRDVPDADV